jgi:RNA polymerase sigma factor (sigma-70 family)
MPDGLGVVLIGDVIGSRRDGVASAAWLRDLVHELDDACGDERLAPFGFTQGDELQGLLDVRADPLTAILSAALRPGEYRLRWAVVHGEVDADSTEGKAPATERTGQAFRAARAAVDAARASHDRLVMVTGRTEVDALLADLSPALVEILDGLTERQRTVARLALIDELRQSEVADRLNVRRATISVAFSRAHVRSLQRLVAGMRKVYSSAVQPGETTTADPSNESQADLLSG